MTSIREVYRSSDTLSASDLPDGIQVPVVIEAVRAVQFDDGNKLELRFRGKRKALLCNKTNALRIADQHGDDYDTWPGKVIMLQRDVTQFQGRDVECVRVRRQSMARPASQSAVPTPNHGGEYSYSMPPAPVGVPTSQGDRARDYNRNPTEIPF
jgi:hypothetical protein